MRALHFMLLIAFSASGISQTLDMPEEVQQHLKSLLSMDEKLLLIEQPLFWPSHGPLLLITGGAVLGLIIFAIVDFQSFLGRPPPIRFLGSRE